MKRSANCQKQVSLAAIGKTFYNTFSILATPFAFVCALLFMVTIYFQFFYKLLSALFIIVHTNMQKQDVPVTGRQLHPVVRLGIS